MDDAALQQSATLRDGAVEPRRVGRRSPRLWPLFAAAVALPVAILATGAWASWRLTWADAARDLARAADFNADYVERSIEGLVQAGTRIAQTVGGKPDEAGSATSDRVVALLGDAPLLRTVLVYGPGGQEQLRIDSRGGGAPGRPAGGLFEALDDATPGTVVTGSAYRRDGEEPVFAIGLRLPAPGGAVVLVVDAVELGRGLARHITSESDMAGLLRLDGQVLSRSPPFEAVPSPLASDTPLMQALAAGRERGSLVGVMPRSRMPVAIAFQRVPGMPDLAVAVVRRRAVVVQSWRQAVLPLLGVGLPAVFALLGLALVVRRQQQALGIALDGLEHRVAERTESLREEQERLRLAVEAGQLGTWETELASGMTTRSPRAVEIFGLTPGIAVSSAEDWRSRIHPADRRRILDAWDALGAGRLALYQVEYRFRHSDGGWCWLESTGSAVRVDPATGRPLRLAGTIKDITERREAEERRELLTQEVNHRARNTLAIVQSILRLAKAGTAAELSRLVEGRVSALARAQSLLAAEHWTGAPLAALIADELTPFGKAVPAAGGAEARLRLDGPAFRIRAEAVQALGMVFHELATNAAKHGALSVPEGQVTITWVVDEATGVLRIRWAETGGPPPSFPTRRGVGSRVIEATVKGQLGGGVDRRWPDEGLVCDLVLPLTQARAGPG
ncbi:PAS domain-containing protein [Roseomonas terrae]|jgi:PAS domain S-box-containing protein|uniref:histidine kinase n=1 Tax=Neoroseomonas terrae TaxID=424799 RepID=A0ABS5EIV3_9PROT|nr:HWE histidine kinase domain-containing protein [Neoroseomonas terrae]MBR0650885.1 PAS domain-containing protein [Neoroseomonas terrae]